MSTVTQHANTPEVSNYETDFNDWIQETAEKIRQHRFHDLDIQALAEEIESLGRRERDTVNSALEQLIAHLLKWQYQLEYRQRAGDTSWKVSIAKQRKQILRKFKKSPSLRRYAKQDLADEYPQAVDLAELESGLVGVFPSECPYTLDQILDPTFFPEAASAQ